MIGAIAQTHHIDLQLHQNGKIFPINNLWLQPKLKPRNQFGYEGYGVVDIRK
jgi:hypothetical protein